MSAPARMKRRIMVRRMLLLFAVATLTVTGVVVISAMKAAFNKPRAEPKVVEPIVATQKVEEKSYPVYIISRGVVKPLRGVVVTAQVAGKIEKIAVEVGSKVEGFVLPEPTASREREVRIAFDDKALAVIEDVDYRLRVEQAWTKLKAADKDYRRNEELFKAGGGDGPVYVTEREYDQSKVQVALNELELKSARLDLMRTRIVNPFSGVVAERYVEAGDRVSPGSRIARVLDLSKVKIEIALTGEEVVRLRRAAQALADGKSLPAKVRVLGSERTYTGRVHTIGNMASEGTGTYPVEILVDNPRRELLANMSAYEVKVRIGRRSLITIPRSAVFDDISGSTFVYLLNSINASRHDVKLDYAFYDDESRVIVVNGLTPADTLIIPKERNITDGSPVRVENHPAVPADKGSAQKPRP